MTELKPGCKNCKLFKYDGDIYGECMWVSTERYPISIWKYADRPTAGLVKPDMGKDCPCFVQKNHATGKTPSI